MVSTLTCTAGVRDYKCPVSAGSRKYNGECQILLSQFWNSIHKVNLKYCGQTESSILKMVCL